MNPNNVEANESAIRAASIRSRLAGLKRYGLAVLSVAVALGASLLLQQGHFREAAVPLLLFAVAMSSWYGGTGPAVLATILSIMGFYWYFIEPVRTIYIFPSEIPYFITFVAFASLMSWFSAIRRRAETTLREQADLLNLTHDTVFVMDMEGVIQYWNRGAEERYGWTAEEVLGRVVHDLLKTVFPAPPEQIKAELMRTGRWEGELVHTRGNGIQVVVASRWALQRDKRGAPVAILETNNDITERKKEELELRKFVSLAENSAEFIGMCDMNLIPFYVNPAGLRLVGLDSLEQTARTPVPEFFFPEDQRFITEEFVPRVVREGRAEVEIRFRHFQTGEPIWMIYTVFHITDAAGRPVGLATASRDIAGRKQAEEALRRSNRELRALSNCNQTLLRATDEQNLLQEICRIVCEEAGYRLAWVAYAEHDEAKSVRPAAWTGTEEEYLANLGITWADTERGCGPTGTAIRSGRTCCVLDFATDHRVAAWRESALQRDFRSGIALPLKDEHANAFGSLTIYSALPNAFTPEEVRLLEELAGDLAFGIVTLRSRAARKRAEQEVALLSFALDSVHEAALLMDDRGRFHYVNEAACRVLGYTRVELLGMGVPDVDPEFPAERWSGHWRDLKTQRSLSFESRHRTRDGRIFPVEIGANYLEYEDRAYNLALVRDITERKHTEEALRLSNAYNRSLIEASLDPLVTIGPDGRITDVNAATEAATGRSRGELIGTDFCDYFTEPAQARVGYEHVFREGEVRDYPLELRHRDGRVMSVLYNASVYRDESGRVIGVFAAARDITERTQAEEKIRQQELEQRQMLDFAPQLVGVFGHDRNRLYANRPTLDYLGVTLEEWQGITDRFLFFHPDDRERIARDVYAESADDVRHEFEARFRRGDGAYRWFLFRESPLRDERGCITRWYLSAMDIEDLKRAEEERQAQVWYLESMDRINRAMQGANDLEQMTGDVIGTILSIFDSDRAFLYYPCDPDAPSFEVFMERHRPEYPVATGVIPMTPDTARGFQIMRASSGVVTFGSSCDYPLVGDFEQRFGHKAAIGIALYPRTGEPWVLAMHQCSYPRVWTPEERKLLEEIARRLAESLTSLLIFRSLRESEQALREQANLLDLTHDTVFVMDMGGVVQYWNRGAEERYDWPAEKVLGRVVHDLLKTVFPSPLSRIKAELMRTGHWEAELVHTRRDGTQVVVASRWALQRDEEGAPFAILETNNDITERKRAEEALRLSNAYNRSLIETSLDPLVTIGPDGKITDVNAATEAGTGRSRGDLIGSDFCDYFTEPAKARAGYEQVFREGLVRDYPLELRHRDGDVISVLYNASVYRNESGEVVGVFAAARDITARKRIEQALRLSNAYNRSLIETSLDPLVTIGPDGKITDVNSTTEAATGRSRGELIGTDFCDYFTEPAKARAGYEQVFREGLVRDYPLELRHRDGDVISVLYNASVYRNESGEVVGVFAAARDITERKRAEEALRLSNAYNRSLIEASLDPLVTIGPDGKITDVNAATEAGTGRSRGELIGTDFCDYFTESAKARAGYEQVFREGSVRDYPLELRHRDGHVMSVLYSAAVYRDESGGVVGVFAAARDVTERKRAEEALRLSNAYNRSLIEASLDPLVTIGPDGRITDVNAATEAATGRSRVELIGADFCDYFTEPAQARLGYEHVFREGAVRDYPLELRHRDGRVMSVLYNASVYRDESGRVIGVFAAARDITERKRREEELRRTTAYLAETQRLTHTGTFVSDNTTRPLYWSEEMFRIFEFDPQQGLPTREQPLQRIHPEDMDKFLQAWDRGIKERVDADVEYRLVLPDGTVKHAYGQGHPVLNANGELVEIVGTTVDITERKRAEEALRESETRFRTFVDHAADAFFMLDFEQGTIIDVNRCACESLGYTRQELIGMTPLAFDVDLDRAAFESAAERAAAGETVLFDRHWHRRKDGSLFPVEVQTSVFRHGGRRFLLKVARDISDHVRAEEQRDRLRQLEADLAHINRVSIMGELAASVAHEVNQPLAGVVSNASAGLRWLAGDTPNLAEAREGLRRIVRDGKRAGEVIARIRALTRKAATPREKLDVNETIQEVLALVGDEAKRKSVIVQTRFADDVFPLLGDRVQLQQVMLNLVMNAIEAMNSVDERARELVITTRNIDPDQVQVTVEDSGPGLDPNTTGRIFDPFYTTKPGGMGMGLSISRSILQAHEGRLWATAREEGPGTSFHFTLPKYNEEESNGAGA